MEILLRNISKKFRERVKITFGDLCIYWHCLQKTFLSLHAGSDDDDDANDDDDDNDDHDDYDCNAQAPGPG